MKASVPKLFFCPGSASYTPVTQGSRWRVASRQLRKPTTPSALAFFVVVRAPSGFPFGGAVQNPITPLTPTLPTRPPLPQNTGPQTLFPPAHHLPNASPLRLASHRTRHFTRRNSAGFRIAKANQRRQIRALPARKASSGARGTDAGGGAKQFRGAKRHIRGGQGARFPRKRAIQTHGRAQSNQLAKTANATNAAEKPRSSASLSNSQAVHGTTEPEQGKSEA